MSNSHSSIPSSSVIAVCATESVLQPAAAALATQLQLPFLAANPMAAEETSYALLLTLTPQQLELRQCGPAAPGPVAVQWESGRLAYRQRHTHIKREAIARAVGLKKNWRPDLIDATAGLGRDGFMLAALGCRVRLVERSPVLAALLQDALRRAGDDPELMAWVNTRLSLHSGDSTAYLQHLPPAQQPDVVYLDPMYPHRQKTALVKKEARLLRAVVGDDDDADRLLHAALQSARQRVVVKRPRIAPVLAGLKPSFFLTGSSTRFDVYLRPAFKI